MMTSIWKFGAKYNYKKIPGPPRVTKTGKEV